MREVRLIDDEGNQLGILPIQEALQLAFERNLDLVEVAPNAVPPVCRLLDYGKYQYEKQKKDGEARKAQKTIEMKEMPASADRRARLGHESAPGCVLSGRGQQGQVGRAVSWPEITDPEIAREQLEEFEEKVGSAAIVELQPLMEGRNLFMLLSPNPAKKQ